MDVATFERERLALFARYGFDGESRWTTDSPCRSPSSSTSAGRLTNARTTTARSATATPGSSAGSPGTWPPQVPGYPHIAWVRNGWEAIKPFSTGGNYVNFQLAEDGAGRMTDAYGKNYERLQRAKATYDPGNLFRVNRNIPPAP